MNKIIQEMQFITFMKSRIISKRKKNENINLCDEFPSFLYDMINDKIDDIYIYEFIYVNYKRANFYKQLYYRDPTKNYWETALSLAIYKEKYTLVSFILMLDDGSFIDGLVRLLFFIIEEVKIDNEKTKILGYLRIFTRILSYVDIKYLNKRFVNGKYLLIQLMELDNHKYFNEFIKKGPIHFEVKYKGMPALMWAIIYQNSYYVKTLLELGANKYATPNTEIINNVPQKYKYDYDILQDTQLKFHCPRFRSHINLNCIDMTKKYYEHLTKYNCIKDENDEIFNILNLFDISYQLPNYECGICYRNYLSNKYKFNSCSHDCCYDCAALLQKEHLNDESIDIVENLFDYDLIIECPFCRKKSIVSEKPLYITLYLCDLNGNYTGKSLEVIPCITKLKDIVAEIYQDDRPFTLSGIRYYVITTNIISINNTINVFGGNPNRWFNSYIRNIGITNGSRILVSTEMYTDSIKLKKHPY